MKSSLCCPMFLLVSLSSISALAGTLPPLPPMTNGDGNPANNGMKHALVSLDAASGALSIHIQQAPATPVRMMSGYGVDYDPAQFDVLENRFFNSQYGWLPDGLWQPPAGSAVWIKRTAVTAPAGGSLSVYEGGMGNMMSMWSMADIYAADGDAWKWDGLMQHDMYVADAPGSYTMSFEAYIGDAVTGAPTAGYAAATTTFAFTAIPEPASWLLVTVAALLATRHRR